MEPTTKCSICGFRAGDRVKMLTGFARFDGKPAGYVYGEIESWKAGCHIVSWEDWPTATALPNPNVELDATSEAG